MQKTNNVIFTFENNTNTKYFKYLSSMSYVTAYYFQTHIKKTEGGKEIVPC